MATEKEELIKLQEILQDNAAPAIEMIDEIIKSYSGDLDDIMEDLMRALTQEEPITTLAVERYYAELTNIVYFMTDKVERLNTYNDVSKAFAKEAYNKSYLYNSSIKDEKGKSVRTVAENTAIAEEEAKKESVVSTIYEHAYKTLRMKIDFADEMISTLKNILKHRMQEEYLSSMTPKNVDNVARSNDFDIEA